MTTIVKFFPTAAFLKDNVPADADQGPYDAVVDGPAEAGASFAVEVCGPQVPGEFGPESLMWNLEGVPAFAAEAVGAPSKDGHIVVR